MTKLFFLNSSVKGQSYELSGDEYVIGRSPDCDIIINDPSVSRVHARITHKGNKFFIEDLKSHNGTWIDNKSIDPGKKNQVKEGTTLTLGNALLSLNKDANGDGLISQFSIDLSEQLQETGGHVTFKDRRLTRKKELILINDVSNILMQSLDIDEICEKIMESLFSCLERIDSGAIFLRDNVTVEPKKIYSRSRRGDNDNRKRYSKTIVNRVISEGKAIIMADTSRENEENLSKSIEAMRIKSIMAVPLISKSEVHGAIYVHSVNVPHGFRSDDLFMLTALSSPASLAIENALLYHRTKTVENELKERRDDLEKQVEERTIELAEANKSLSQAYAQMRDWKDRLSIKLFGEEIGMIIDEEGMITGFTEQVMEIIGKSRTFLLGYNIIDLIHEDMRESFKEGIRKAHAGLFYRTTAMLKDFEGENPVFDVRVMNLTIKRKKHLLVLMRPAEEG